MHFIDASFCVTKQRQIVDRFEHEIEKNHPGENESRRNDEAHTYGARAYVKYNRAEISPKIETHKLEFSVYWSNLLSIASRSLFIIYRLVVGWPGFPQWCPMHDIHTHWRRRRILHTGRRTVEFVKNANKGWCGACILQFRPKVFNQLWNIYLSRKMVKANIMPLLSGWYCCAVLPSPFASNSFSSRWFSSLSLSLALFFILIPSGFVCASVWLLLRAVAHDARRRRLNDWTWTGHWTCTRKCVTIYIVFTASWSGRCILKCVCRKHDYDWIIPCTVVVVVVIVVLAAEVFHFSYRIESTIPKCDEQNEGVTGLNVYVCVCASENDERATGKKQQSERANKRNDSNKNL